MYVQALRQASQRLLGDGMEGGECEVFPACSRVEQGLDIGLGIGAATSEYVVDDRVCTGGVVKLFNGE